MPASDPASLSLLFIAAVCLPALVCALVLQRALRAQRSPRPMRRRRAGQRRLLRVRRRLMGADRLELRQAGGTRVAAAAARLPRRREPENTPSARPAEPRLVAASRRRHAPATEAEFRHALVVLMFDALECWERNGGTRITLAERSGVWHVTRDDGRLRVRSMERYLTPSRLPKRPRWRDVLRSAHYVLSHVPLSAEDRARVLAAEEKVRTLARRRAFDGDGTDDDS